MTDLELINAFWLPISKRFVERQGAELVKMLAGPGDDSFSIMGKVKIHHVDGLLYNDDIQIAKLFGVTPKGRAVFRAAGNAVQRPDVDYTQPWIVTAAQEGHRSAAPQHLGDGGLGQDRKGLVAALIRALAAGQLIQNTAKISAATGVPKHSVRSAVVALAREGLIVADTELGVKNNQIQYRRTA